MEQFYLANFSWLAPGWWLSLGYFLLVVVMVWLIPGLVVLSRSGLAKRTSLIVAPVIGLCAWSLQGYVFGYLGCRFLTYLYLIICWYFAWRWRRELLPRLTDFKQWGVSKLVVVILTIGVIGQLVGSWGSGWQTDEGLPYYFINGYDGIFHLSLTRALIDGVPPVQPGAAGLLVTNYHYFSNLAVAELSRVFGLPIGHTYFQFLPLVMSVWFGLLLLELFTLWTKPSARRATTIAGLLLFYFAGEITWLAHFVLGNFSESAWNVYLEHPVQQFFNPPQAMAKLGFLALLLIWRGFHQQVKRGRWCLGLVLALMTACLFGFKVYFGIAVVVGITVTWIGEFMCTVLKRQLGDGRWWWQKVAIYVLMGVICLAVFLPTNAESGGLFFAGLAWPKILLHPDKLNLNEWWLRLQVYQEAGNYKALVVYYGFALALFVAVMYHLRLLGLVLIKKLQQNMKRVEVWFLLAVVVVMSWLGINYLQVSGGANTFNFTIIAICVLNLTTAVVWGGLVTRWRQLKYLGLVLFALTLPQWFFLLGGYFRNYYYGSDRVMITAQEQVALNYLRELPEGVVMQTLLNHRFDYYAPYLYYFTGKQTYYGGRGVLASHNQPVDERQAAMQLMVDVPLESATIAAELDFDYLYLEIKDFNRGYFESYIQPTATLSGVPHWEIHYDDGQYAVVSPNMEDWYSSESGEVE